MNKLQNLGTSENYFVSLNPVSPPKKENNNQKKIILIPYLLRQLLKPKNKF